jgi:hypothetical protein
VGVRWPEPVDDAGGGVVGFAKSSRQVGTYSFYVLEAEWGSGSVNICTYFLTIRPRCG